MKKVILAILLTSGMVIQSCSQTYDSGMVSGKNKVLIEMEDSIALAANVFIPKGKSKFPTVLVRTPYNKYADEWMGKAFNLFRIAVVIQDVRGKFQSQGEFYPFVNERDDGLQTLRWIREQPWSNGTIAGWGGSYMGYTQWIISDSLDFLTLLLTGSNLYDFVYPDSLFSLQTAYIWSTENAATELNKIDSSKRSRAINTLPLINADDSAIKDIDFFNDWVIHEKYDEYWQNLKFRGQTDAPVLSMAGWYDLFLKAQLADFQSLSSAENDDSRMVIGPWVHGTPGEPNEYGGLDKTGKPTQIFKYVRRILKGKGGRLTSPLHDTKYNLFIMERNEYAGSEVWPPAETSPTPFFIGPDGYLSETGFQENGNLKYIYNPSDPFPSYGGTTLGKGVGPARQNANAARKDQVVFEMAVDEEPLILLGPISASLWLSGSSECTDFIVGLQDVFPDGKIINIQEGGAKVKFSSDNPSKHEISVWATGYQLNPGHKLRVFISSSWFPRYNRTLNNCEPAAGATTITVAQQTVWYGPDTPSSITLPVYDISSAIK